MIFGFPSWILGLTFDFGWFFVFALKRVIQLNRQIKDARVAISSLREAGVELRNRGSTKLKTNADWESWRDETIQWEKDVYEAIKKISVADAEWFKTIDALPLIPRVQLVKPINSDTHPKRYREHDFQLKRLGEMIRDLWGK